MENAAIRHLNQPEYQPFTGGDGPLNITNNVNDSAVVVMNAKTGEVLAMNGSTDWSDPTSKVDGQFNAALAARSPGSSFKPIVLAAAMEMGWYEGIVLPDKKTYFPNGASQSLPVKPVHTFQLTMAVTLRIRSTTIQTIISAGILLIHSMFPQSRRLTSQGEQMSIL